MFPSFQVLQNDRILDVGCGNAGFTAWMAEQACSGYVLGVDNVPQIITKNMSAYPKTQYPSLHFRVADAAVLDFEEGPFRQIVSRACLHYLACPEKAVSAMARHLQPQGRLYIQCLGKGNAAVLNRTILKTTQEAAWRSFFPNFQFSGSLPDQDASTGWLIQAGLSKVDIRLGNDPMVFQHKQAFSHWIYQNWGHYFHHLPPIKGWALINEVVERYCGSKAGSIKVPRVWLFVEAQKK